MSTTTLMIPQVKRSYLPENLIINDWEIIKPYFDELEKRPISSKDEFEQWLRDYSELSSAYSEEGSWRHIKMTCDTTDKEKAAAFEYMVTVIDPQAQPYYNAFNIKINECPFTSQLDMNVFAVMLRDIKNNIELYKEENIPLQAKIATESAKYGEISGAMIVEHEGKELTIQQAMKYLKSPKRELREEIYRKVLKRRAVDDAPLNNLFDELLALRNTVALNAGYNNFRDYRFAELGRFDYTVKDCQDFSDSIAQEVMPVVEQLDKERKALMGYEVIKPWDTEVDPLGKEPLKPFETSDELIQKTIECFNRLDPYFASCINTMREMDRLDLNSRKGKAPGGYNASLDETGAPFIFMNSVGSLNDLVTMVHEGGHAVHSFLVHQLPINSLRHFPSEVAELASMSMELMSMEHWDVFFESEEDLKRAKKEHLERILRLLPSIARGDSFQHWIYMNPEQTSDQRNAKWLELNKMFLSSVTDRSGFEKEDARSWQNILHFFEVPFYYIEYGFAQLGALAVWRNFKKNPELTVSQYKNALSLGYTKPIPEVYKAAGIEFNFSSAYIRELISFVKSELAKLN